MLQLIACIVLTCAMCGCIAKIVDGYRRRQYRKWIAKIARLIQSDTASTLRAYHQLTSRSDRTVLPEDLYKALQDSPAVLQARATYSPYRLLILAVDHSRHLQRRRLRKK